MTKKLQLYSIYIPETKKRMLIGGHVKATTKPDARKEVIKYLRVAYPFWFKSIKSLPKGTTIKKTKFTAKGWL